MVQQMNDQVYGSWRFTMFGGCMEDIAELKKWEDA